MQIDVTYDPSVGSAPAGFTAAVNYVVGVLDAAFTNNVTININVGWGEVDGISLPQNVLGASEQTAAPVAYHYSDITAALANEPSVIQQAANATLALSDPTNGGNFDIGSADAKALGLIAGNSAAVDGWVGINSTANWSFTPNIIPAADAYDIVGTLEHEITEVMGRDSLSGIDWNYANAFTVMDMFRFSAKGVRSLAPGAVNKTAYFSIDNGMTGLGTWNNHLANGDLGDWYPAGPAHGGNDAFNDYSKPGVLNVLSANDLINMYVIGWNPSAPEQVNVVTFIHTAGGGGDWNTASNWSTGSVPAATDIALLPAKGIYTVRSTQDNDVAILQTAKTATFTVQSHEFDITGGTGIGANAGIIKVADGAMLGIGGTINNTGTIAVGSTGDATGLIILGAATLTGVGHVTLTNNLGNAIESDGSPATLTNANNKIVGAGTIADANLTLDNQANGVIEALGDHSLTIDVGAFNNEGKLESAGNLVIANTTVADSASGLVATLAAASHIDLDGATITGGTVSVFFGSTIDTLNDNASTISGAVVTNAGTLTANHGNLTVNGAVTNAGVLAADDSILDITGAVTGKGTATIADSGTLEFGGASSAKVTFLDHTGTLQLDAATTVAARFTGTIVGFAHGSDDIDLGAINFTSGNAQLGFVENKAHSSGVLTVADGTHTETLTFMGNYAVTDFTTLPDVNNHVDLLHV
jgi:hypothetical protein